MITPVEFFQDNAGTTLTCVGLDNTGKIIYNINNQGFRNKCDYSESPDIAFFGCSSVFGIGVDQEKVFTSYFKNSQNFGLAVRYNNQMIFETVEAFIKSSLYSSDTKIVIIWCDKDDYNNILKYISLLNDYQVYNFKIGYHNIKDIPSLPSQIDCDISKTHLGPKTHKLWALYIRGILNATYK